MFKGLWTNFVQKLVLHRQIYVKFVQVDLDLNKLKRLCASKRCSKIDTDRTVWVRLLVRPYPNHFGQKPFLRQLGRVLLNWIESGSRSAHGGVVLEAHDLVCWNFGPLLFQLLQTPRPTPNEEKKITKQQKLINVGTNEEVAELYKYILKENFALSIIF